MCCCDRFDRDELGLDPEDDEDDEDDEEEEEPWLQQLGLLP